MNSERLPPDEVQRRFGVREIDRNRISMAFECLWDNQSFGELLVNVYEPTRSVSWNRFFPYRNSTELDVPTKQGIGTLAHILPLLEVRNAVEEWWTWKADYTISGDLNMLPAGKDHFKKMGYNGIPGRVISFPEHLAVPMKYAISKGSVFPDDVVQDVRNRFREMVGDG